MSSTYTAEENLPNDGTGITNANLLSSAVYVKSKKLGIGNALGSNVFPGGEAEMLDQIEITGFEITGETVVTKFKINRVPTAATGATSSA